MELLVYPAIYEIWKWNFELRPRLDRKHGSAIAKIYDAGEETIIPVHKEILGVQDQTIAQDNVARVEKRDVAWNDLLDRRLCPSPVPQDSRFDLNVTESFTKNEG
jgi:hypothetical protein